MKGSSVEKARRGRSTDEIAVYVSVGWVGGVIR